MVRVVGEEVSVKFPCEGALTTSVTVAVFVTLSLVPVIVRV
jgi:hypothetical protein